MHNLSRIRITIRGAVQGVGFRPFVYRLATEIGLTGWVTNTTQGVLIEAEGCKEDLDSFLLRLGNEHPRQASIHSLEYSFLDSKGSQVFEIRQSGTDGRRAALV